MAAAPAIGLQDAFEIREQILPFRAEGTKDRVAVVVRLLDELKIDDLRPGGEILSELVHRVPLGAEAVHPRPGRESEAGLEMLIFDGAVSEDPSPADGEELRLSLEAMPEPDGLETHSLE
jgi:hypothetical protein